jgi:hypothetical protein
VKIGAQDKKKVILMVVLVVIAIASVIYMFNSFQSPTPAAAVSEPQPAATPASRGNQKGIPRLRDNSLDPTLHTDILAASQKIEYTGGTRNIFHMEEAPPPQPVAPVRQPVYQTPMAAEPPPKPPIPLKFYGFTNRPGEPRRAFLQDGDNIFVAVEGDIVERRYKIVKITNTFVLVEDVLNNNQQTINLTAPSPNG